MHSLQLDDIWGQILPNKWTIQISEETALWVRGKNKYKGSKVEMFFMCSKKKKGKRSPSGFYILGRGSIKNKGNEVEPCLVRVGNSNE